MYKDEDNTLRAEVQQGLSFLRSAADRMDDVARDVRSQLKSKAARILRHDQSAADYSSVVLRTTLRVFVMSLRNPGYWWNS
jgi:hypothetical protein